MGKWTKYFTVHRNKTQHETVTVACEQFSNERKKKIEEGGLEDWVKEILSLLYPKKRKINVQRLEKEEKSRHEALEISPKKALDLGAGTGRDSFFLAKQGFLVLAVDNEPESFEVIREVSRELDLPEPKFQQESFESLELNEQFDLINASLSLPFTKPENFQSVWTTVVQHIKDNGRFSGHFFGNQHSWLDEKSGMTFLTLNECLDLFRASFEIEFFKIEAKFVHTVSEGIKFWHEFDVVARKKTENPQPMLFSVSRTQLTGVKEKGCLKRGKNKSNDHDDRKYKHKSPKSSGLKKSIRSQ